MEDTAQDHLLFPKEVSSSFKREIRERVDTLLRERGQTWPEFYKQLGFDKVQACRIRNGIIIPEYPIQIKIAKAFGVDSKTIWPTEEGKCQK